MNHEHFIRETYHLANKAAMRGDHPFGALLVKDDVILATSENTVVTTRNGTRHAELNLLTGVPQDLGQNWFVNSILYTSTEPCVMCAGAIYWAGISSVIFGCSAKSLADFAGSDLTIPCREVFKRGKRDILIIGPILEEEGALIHKSYW